MNTSNTKSKCPKCEETVYPMDEAVIEGIKYHKSCLRCEVCKRIVTLGNYASLDGSLYCKPHFKQSFTLKGNYRFSPSSASLPIETDQNISDDK